MSQTAISKYDLRAPRYTSYPTAPHFTPAVGAGHLSGWLKALPEDARLSLYLHIPFCSSLCWFCGCNMAVVNRHAPVARYVAGLAAEIDLFAAALGPGRTVSSIHFGGGSPTMLSADEFTALTARLRKRFRVAEDVEFSVEIDPRTLEEDFVHALALAGVTRASLGVQDFDPVVQKAVNRYQPLATTRTAVRILREAGIARLNVDLMYGLPHQNAESVALSARLALGLVADRVALFGYAHVPWMKPHQRLIDEKALPEAGERLRQFTAASEALIRGGLRPIGLDHFAAPWDGLARAADSGHLRRNFQGYTDDKADALIGLGASAISTLPQGFAQNAGGVREWRAAIDGGGLAATRGLTLDDDDRLRGEVIERLMCDLAVDLETVCARHGRNADCLAPSLASLAPLADDGLVEISRNTVRVPGRGRPFLRLVCAAFDAYLDRGEERHARAI